MIEAAPSPPGTEDLLADLTAAQRAAVVCDAAPLAVLAAAGAGKTRVLTRRIAYRCRTGRAAAGHTLALTFTRKAAGELQHRLSGLGLRDGVAAGTFHSHATAQLQRWWADRGQARPVLLERKSKLLGPLVEGRPGLGSVPLAEIAGVIEWAKARAVSPAELPAALAAAGRPVAGGVDPADLAALYGRYEHEKVKRGLVDFDDLLARCADAIERDAEFAAAQRWCWRHVYVDEFQDLNPLQHRLLQAWLGPSVDLCVVGDPNQAIYGWNGAEPGLLESFATRWPGAEVLRLDVNHRSTGRIVRVAAAVLGPAGRHLSASERQGQRPEVASFASEHAEARGIVAALTAAHGAGRPWSSMAVLTRTNAQLAPVEEALALAGVPCWSAASAALLDQPEVRRLLGELRRTGSTPLRAALVDLEEMSRAGTGGPGRFDEAGPAGGRAGGGAASGAGGSGVAALIDTGRGLLSSRPESTVADWLEWLPAGTRDRSDGRPGGSDAVTLSSFHRAKGLEWPLVWVAGVEEGLVPLGRARSADAEREERRLLYVAMTRAIDELHLSWAQTRRYGGRPVPRRPSRWLAEVLEACAAEADDDGTGADAALGTGTIGAEGTGRGSADGSPGDPSGWRDRLEAQRAALRDSLRRSGPAGGHDPDFDATRHALRAWRLEMARHSGVPPRVLLHDATIDAIAARRPADIDGLLAVPGCGPVKAGRYGPAILDLIAHSARPASA